MLYENNLRVKNAEIKEQDGIKKIKIELEGQQLSYFENQMIQGTDILIPATIILKKDIQSTNSNISYTYTNGYTAVKYYYGNIPVIIKQDQPEKNNSNLRLKVENLQNEIYSTTLEKHTEITENNNLEIEVKAQVRK